MAGTTTALARVDVDTFLAQPNRAAELAQFRVWLEQSGTLADALSAAEQAERLAKWIRVAKLANEIAVEALRVEAVALRMIARADALEQLSQHRRTTARILADMADAEFDALLEDLPDTWPNTLIGWIKAHARRVIGDTIQQDDWAAYQRAAQGEPLPRLPETPIKYHGTVERAATQLLLDLVKRGERFTTDEAVHILAERFDLDLDDPTSMQGCRFLIRDAVRYANTYRAGNGAGIDGCGVPGSYSLDGERVTLPAVVTYYETGCPDREGYEAGSFVRVPIQRASLDQFALMAEYRQVQARDLQSQADALTRMVTWLREEKGPAPGESGSVWERLRSGWCELDRWSDDSDGGDS